MFSDKYVDTSFLSAISSLALTGQRAEKKCSDSLSICSEKGFYFFKGGLDLRPRFAKSLMCHTINEEKREKHFVDQATKGTKEKSVRAGWENLSSDPWSVLSMAKGPLQSRATI